jgi:N-acetylglucosaminyl-diphospho-decaprenol L-rhamnosyltransferase
MTQVAISISVVSHGQAELVSALLNDIQKHCDGTSLEVVLTVNVPEDLPDTLKKLSFPLKIICNSSPLGFGENHNHAFRHAVGGLFCIINPDIRIETNIFPVLMESLNDCSIGVVAPLVVDGNGEIEDSARRFPTPLKIICKATGRCTGRDYVIKDTPIYPDWVGGMFMVLRRDVFEEVGGFNQKYFLYYEDVDLCARVLLRGLRVALIPQVRATHVARRSSHGDARYFWIHIRSMVRFFLSFTFLKVMYLRMVR